MIRLKLRVNPQGLLFPGSDQLMSPSHAATVVGRFYEVLAQAIVGGELANMQGSNPFQPDIEIFEKEVWVEVKATGDKSQLKLMCEQLDKYAEMEQTKFPFNRPRIKFMIFVHKVSHMHRDLKTEGNLVAALAQNTFGCVLIPFRFIRKLPYSYAIKWFNPNHGECYEYRLVSTSQLKKFIADPELMRSMDRAENFSFTRHLISDIIIDGVELKPFPLLKVMGREKCRVKINFPEVKPEGRES